MATLAPRRGRGRGEGTAEAEDEDEVVGHGPGSDLLVHDGRQLTEQVPVVSPHLLLVLQLVLLDQTLVDVQGLAARVRKAPAAATGDTG